MKVKTLIIIISIISRKSGAKREVVADRRIKVMETLDETRLRTHRPLFSQLTTTSQSTLPKCKL